MHTLGLYDRDPHFSFCVPFAFSNALRQQLPQQRGQHKRNSHNRLRNFWARSTPRVRPPRANGTLDSTGKTLWNQKGDRHHGPGHEETIKEFRFIMKEDEPPQVLRTGSLSSTLAAREPTNFAGNSLVTIAFDRRASRIQSPHSAGALSITSPLS